MPTYVDPNACNACAGEHQGPLCVYICPNDLMVLDNGSKGLNQEPGLCSECYACVKLCPQEAIHVRGYSDFVPLGASVQPKRVPLPAFVPAGQPLDGASGPPHQGASGGPAIYGLTWTVKFRDGRELQFTYPSRTIPIGSADPYKDFTEDPVAELKGQGLAGESLWLGVDKLPSPA